MPIWCWTKCDFVFSAKKNFLIVHFVDIDQLSLIIIQKRPSRHCPNLSWPQYSVNIIPQDQIDDAPIWFTAPIPLLRNQVILATPAISWLPWKKRCVFRQWKLHLILRINCNHWKKIYASNWSMCNCAVEYDSPKCDALHILVLFVQFKTREKHSWRSVNFSLLHGCFSRVLNCTNGTKSRNAPQKPKWHFNS